MSALWERSLARLVCVVLVVAAMLCSSGFAAEQWSFIVTADSRDGTDAVNLTIMPELVDEILNHDVEFVLFPGDLVQGWPLNYVDSGNTTSLENQLLVWRDVMQPVYDAGIGVYPVRGNHELNHYSYGPSVTAWNNVFTGPYALPDNGPEDEINQTYSVTHKNVFVLGLDEYVAGRIHMVNQEWIDQQLATNGRGHIFAYGHVPAFALHSGCLDVHVPERDAFWTSLEDAGAHAYFCGDTHLYDRARADADDDPSNDVHQVVVGTAGAPIYTWSPPYEGPNSDWDVYQIYHAEQYGYVLVEMDGVDATLTWMERVDNDTYLAMEQWSYTVPAPTTCSEVFDAGYGMQTDLNADCQINWGDFAVFADQWLDDQCGTPADFDGSCLVDWADFAIFAPTWLDCNDPQNIPPCTPNW